MCKRQYFTVHASSRQRRRPGRCRSASCILYFVSHGALNWAKSLADNAFIRTLYRSRTGFFIVFFLPKWFGFVWSGSHIFCVPECVYFMMCYLKIICNPSAGMWLRKYYQEKWFIWIGCTQYDTELAQFKHNSSWWVLSDVFHSKHVAAFRHAWAYPGEMKLILVPWAGLDFRG